jgi:hypothetical protein
MENRPTTLERAFELARQGLDVREIEGRLKAEHLSPQQIFGPLLRKQLKAIGVGARDSGAA